MDPLPREVAASCEPGRHCGVSVPPVCTRLKSAGAVLRKVCGGGTAKRILSRNERNSLSSPAEGDGSATQLDLLKARAFSSTCTPGRLRRAGARQAMTWPPSRSRARVEALPPEVGPALVDLRERPRGQSQHCFERSVSNVWLTFVVSGGSTLARGGCHSRPRELRSLGARSQGALAPRQCNPASRGASRPLRHERGGSCGNGTSTQ
jgi:hypothetical protein